MALGSDTEQHVRDHSYLEFLKTLRLGFVLRNAFALFTFGVCWLLRNAGLLAFPTWPFLTVITAELLINQSWPGVLRRIQTVEGLKRLSLQHILVDILAVSACLYLGGGLRVAFLNLAYLFLILWAGFFLSARACYITAFSSAVAYAAVLAAHFAEQFEPFEIVTHTQPLPLGTLYLAAGLGHTAVLLLVAYFGAKAAELLVSHQQAEQTSLTLKANLDQTFRQLVRSEKLAATGELAAGMAHEIYNPLTAIAGLAETTLLNPNGTSPKTLETLRTIKEQAERAGAVVRRLLGFARPADLHLASCQLNDVVTEALAMVRYKADLHRIAVELHLEPRLPPIVADYWQLQEVCVNLFLNAVQAMPQGGQLRVMTRVAPQEQVELQVTDSGCGIPASHLPRIFDPFFTTKPVGIGTGLGLSVTHSVVQRHCGTIDVQSQPGQGTTFVIRLPLDTSRASQHSDVPGATIVDLTRSMAGPSILVVDDDQAVCQMLAQFLVDTGYQVTTAHSGAEAMALILSERPDLVLLDVRMPGMDGLECLRRLKAHRGDTPVVMVTAVDDQEVAEHCLRLGAAEYLVKPTSLENLRATIATHLRAKAS